jgi:hypothetical protein
MSTIAKVAVGILAILGGFILVGIILGLLKWAIVIAVIAAIGYGVVKVLTPSKKALPATDQDLHKQLKQLETDANQLTKLRK